ncbi:acyl-CoA thioesterase [Salipiger sp. IMCC34102]|uniref:acyl-CoA thioesterase n=1 Tax=Salipiger sp. IMCC34102 TaxID=2510647 RepID=UPI00101C4871|nr:acyl-CoA thioesterase [Salipiger sp. IMCC34102]RYH04054.1 acyl-CoA thioesterase [Salipiger sp. IMCC34102]
MYPFVRLAKEFVVHHRAADLPITGAHVSHHRCWPHDLDVYLEMNNGRILTILDLGRTILARRTGLLRVMRQERWGLAMAGASVRWRRRIRSFERFRVVSRCVGWDARFFYLDQSIWVGEVCAAQGLYRAAVTDRGGMVDPARVFAAIGSDGTSPPLPAWVRHWTEAEAERPWPPELPEAP